MVPVAGSTANGHGSAPPVEVLAVDGRRADICASAPAPVSSSAHSNGRPVSERLCTSKWWERLWNIAVGLKTMFFSAHS